MVFVILRSAKLKRDFWKITIFGSQNRKRKILYFGIFDLFFWIILSPVLPVCICKNPRCFRGLRAQILGTVSAPKSTGKANRRKLRNEKVNKRIASSVFSVFAVFCFRCKAFWLPLSGKYQINDKHPAQVKSRLVWGVSLCFYGRNDNNIYWQKQMK